MGEVPVSDLPHLLEEPGFGRVGGYLGGPEDLITDDHQQRGYECQGGEQCQDYTQREDETHGAYQREAAEHQGTESDDDRYSGGYDGFARPDDGFCNSFNGNNAC